MNPQAIINTFRRTNALLDGHFLLSSGLHSPQYLQCAQILQYPKISEKICRLLATIFNEDTITTVVAPALGGVVVSYEVARALNVKSFFTERVDGKMCLRRGFSLDKNDKVLVVEDVITTGRSTNEVINVVKACGAQIVGVGCIVDRSVDKIDFGTKFRSLLKIEIAAFKPGKCPLCKDGILLVKPGSRQIK